MALPDLTGQQIQDTYQRVLQTDGSILYDGTGSIINTLPITASHALTASYAVSASHEIIKKVSSSFADTASYVNPLNQDVQITGELYIDRKIYTTRDSMERTYIDLNEDTFKFYASNQEKVSFNLSETVFNPSGGGTTDFRIAGDTNSNLFYADVGTEKVGIGTNSPSSRLQVKGSGTTSSTTALRVKNANSSASLVITDDSLIQVANPPFTTSTAADFEGILLSNTAEIRSNSNSGGRVAGFRLFNPATSNGQLELYRAGVVTTQLTSGDQTVNNYSFVTYGNFGLGTSTPDKGKLVISSRSIRNAAESILYVTGSTSDSYDLARFVSDDTARVVITNSGSVGIGTTSPTTTLDVRGTISQTVDGSTNQYPLSLYNDHSGTDYYLLRQRVVNSGNQVRTGLGITSVPDAAFVLGSQTDQILKFATSGRIRNVQEILASSTLKIIGTDIRFGDGTSSQGDGVVNIVGASGKEPLLIQEESGTTENRFIKFLDSGSTEVMGITTDGGFIASTDTLIKRFSYSHAYDGSNVSDGQGVGISFLTDDQSNNLRDIAYIDAVQDDISEDESSLRFSVGETTPTEVMRLKSDGSVGIGTTSPSPSAILDIASTSKGVLFPRMTSAQRTSISSPTTGLIVYQTDSTEGLYIYKSTGWVQII